jgi:hypothetical protein
VPPAPPAPVATLEAPPVPVALEAEASDELADAAPPAPELEATDEEVALDEVVVDFESVESPQATESSEAVAIVTKNTLRIKFPFVLSWTKIV